MAKASGLRQVPWITVPEITHQHRESRPGNRPAGGGASRGGSDHRDGGALSALEIPGHGIGIFSRDQAELFDGLTAATDGGGDALMAIGLYAIWVGVKHQEADLAAGSGGAGHGRKRRGTPRPRPAGAEAARTASAARPDPCRLCRSGHAGSVHAASMARAAAAVW